MAVLHARTRCHRTLGRSLVQCGMAPADWQARVDRSTSRLLYEADRDLSARQRAERCRLPDCVLVNGTPVQLGKSNRGNGKLPLLLASVAAALDIWGDSIQSSFQTGPHLGVTYRLTDDGRTVVRAFNRMHDAVANAATFAEALEVFNVFNQGNNLEFNPPTLTEDIPQHSFQLARKRRARVRSRCDGSSRRARLSGTPLPDFRSRLPVEHSRRRSCTRRPRRR